MSTRRSMPYSIGRLISSVRTTEEMWMELDSHADTTCAGANCIVLEFTQQVVDVTPYNKNKYEPETNIPIVKAATAYTDSSGNTYILILNQALYLPDLDHSLLNPNQMRMNGVTVDDCPQHLSDPRCPSTHSIFSPDLDIRIPLELGGVISRICTQCPTKEELEHCLWLNLTSDLEWDPHSESFAVNESNSIVLNDDGRERERTIYGVSSNGNALAIDHLTDNVVLRTLSCITSSLTHRGLHDKVNATVNVTPVYMTRFLSGLQTDYKRTGVTKEDLARLWNIPLKTAAQTIQVTTQKGIRMSIHPFDWTTPTSTHAHRAFEY